MKKFLILILFSISLTISLKSQVVSNVVVTISMATNELHGWEYAIILTNRLRVANGQAPIGAAGEKLVLGNLASPTLQDLYKQQQDENRAVFEGQSFADDFKRRFAASTLTQRTNALNQLAP